MSKIVETDFNFNDAVQDIMNGKNISGKDGVLAPLVKQLVEAALEAELESHITQDVYAGNKNRKNGASLKEIEFDSSVTDIFSFGKISKRPINLSKIESSIFSCNVCIR